MKNSRAIRFYITIAALLITIIWSGICITKVVLSDNDSNYEKAVDGNIIENEYLKEDLKISLTEKDTNKETVMTLSEIKDMYNLKDNITKEELDSALKNDGYVADTEVEIDKEVFYNQLIMPNKYYIQEYNEHLAIYKSGDKCELTIEDINEDIYNNSIEYSRFSDVDKKYFESYKAEFDTKEEARDYMTQFIS